MPIDKVWINRVLFVCLCFFVCTARIMLAASNFVRWFRGVLGTESSVLGNFALPPILSIDFSLEAAQRTTHT